MLGYIEAVETVILERRKRKKKPKVLGWSAVFPKVPLEFNILFHRGV